MRIIFLIFVVLFSVCNFTIAEINDVKCDAQLEYFNQALSKRERWSIDCKSYDIWHTYTKNHCFKNLCHLL